MLALENAADNLEDLHNTKLLRKLIYLIADEVESKKVEEIGVIRYLASGFEGFEALQYMLMIVGCLEIQAGENPVLMKEKLFAFAPEEVEGLFQKETKDLLDDHKKVEEYLKSFYVGEVVATPGEEYYFLLKATDYALRSLDDSNVQRVLWEIDNYYLAAAMKRLSGEGRRRILTNMTENLAIDVINYMQSIEPEDEMDIIEGSRRIMFQILKMLQGDMIESPKKNVLIACDKVLEASEGGVIRNDKIISAENNLLRVMEAKKNG